MFTVKGIKTIFRFAILVLLCLSIVLLLSETFLFAGAHHKHHNPYAKSVCMTCTHIKHAEALRDQLTTIAGYFLLFATCLLFSFALFPFIFVFMKWQTLRGLKIRINV